MVILKLNQVTQKQSNGELLGIWYCTLRFCKGRKFLTGQQVHNCGMTAITDITLTGILFSKLA